MFDDIQTGQTVTLKMQGSVQGLAMRAIYDGEIAGVHHLHGFGIMAGVEITAEETPSGWALGNGRPLLAVEA